MAWSLSLLIAVFGGAAGGFAATGAAATGAGLVGGAAGGGSAGLGDSVRPGGAWPTCRPAGVARALALQGFWRGDDRRGWRGELRAVLLAVLGRWALRARQCKPGD